MFPDTAFDLIDATTVTRSSSLICESAIAASSGDIEDSDKAVRAARRSSALIFRSCDALMVICNGRGIAGDGDEATAPPLMMDCRGSGGI